MGRQQSLLWTDHYGTEWRTEWSVWKCAQGKPIIKLDGSRVGKTVMEMEGSDRFKEYLKGQITELGDGLDMSVMNDFWFLACLSDWVERPVTELGSLEKVQEIERPRPCFRHAEFEVALAHTGGHVHCLILKPCIWKLLAAKPILEMHTITAASNIMH